MERKTIRLREVFAQAEFDLAIANLATDSRQVGPGALFFCQRGDRADGHDYATEAARRGAVALVVERRLALELPQLVVPSVREALGPAASRFYGEASRKLNVAAVTGTNGKTTVAYMLHAMLDAAHGACGRIGTIANRVAGETEASSQTTPDAIDMQRLLAKMVGAGERHCVIEASSHGLAQGRIDGTSVDAAIFTNLSHEHLDYHQSMDDYFGAKRRLFDMDQTASIVNLDDRYGRALARELPHALTYSLEREADYRADLMRSTLAGSTFEVTCASGTYVARTNLVGRYNVANTLAGLAAAHALGVTSEQALTTLRRFRGPPGRFERVSHDRPFEVIVDYAHTPDAVMNLLKSVRELTRGRVICVLGCAGGRDASIRAPIGAIAAQLADISIVTTDNPSPDRPEQIARDIVRGANGKARAILDRREAIAEAVRLARIGDTIVIAGRGHERWQQVSPRYARPFDDAAVAGELLAGQGG